RFTTTDVGCAPTERGGNALTHTTMSGTAVMWDSMLESTSIPTKTPLCRLRGCSEMKTCGRRPTAESTLSDGGSPFDALTPSKHLCILTYPHPHSHYRSKIMMRNGSPWTGY
ncbi:uncharacterized protein Tco025E_05994, partial [Trypanosoma conorhini]